jgi:hypothetical protein
MGMELMPNEARQWWTRFFCVRSRTAVPVNVAEVRDHMRMLGRKIAASVAHGVN